MSKQIEITISEWLDELAAIGRKNDAGHTTRELAAMSGCNEKSIMRRLQAARDAGRLVLGWRTMTSIDGRPMKIPVYRVAPAKRVKR